MDIGGTKTEPPRPFLQERPAGNSAPTSSTTCSNLPLDDARPVALETTPNPLSYWPPPALPLKNGSTKDSSNQSSDHSVKTDSGPQAPSGETPPATKCDLLLDTGLPARILHHNLPPIAGITSSHNYRGVREVVQKHSLTPVDESKLEKPSTGESPAECGENKPGRNVLGKESVSKTDSDKEKPDDGADCEIVEVPATSSAVERPKPDYVFSIPAAVSSASQTKPMVSPRAPTPFVSSPSPATETLTLNINPSSNLSGGSPSPSGWTVPSPSGRTIPSPSNRAAPSPHFMAPSPTIQCPSPSEIPRILPPSNNLHRVLSTSHVKIPSSGDTPRILSSPHNPPSPSQHRGGVSYPPNTHSNLTYLPPRTNFTNSPVQNFHPDTSRQDSTSQPPRMTLPQMNLPNPAPQRINQSTENQICRNPFELPISKSYYQTEHHPNNIRTPDGQYMNLPREQHKLTGFYPPGFKPLPASDVKYKPGVVPSVQPEPKRPPTTGNMPKLPEQMGNKPNGGWIKPESSDNMAFSTQNPNKNYNKVNGNEYSNRKIPEVGYHNAVKHPPPPAPPENFPGRFGDKQNGSFNQMNSLSQRFPPVPQSNYDLNRHIYDSMNEAGRTVQPQLGRLPEKNAQFPGNALPCKTQPYYRDLPDQEKTKNYMPTVKAGEFAGGVRHPTTYGQYNNLLEKSGQDVYQNKRQNQPAVNHGFPQPSNDTRHSIPGTIPDHHRNIAQGFVPRMNTSTTLPQDRNRQIFPQKQPEYDGKKLLEVKSGGSSQYPAPQQMVPPVQPKTRPPSSTTVPVRSKRESPLDLSVKTVRQSADSTAKDDSEVYLQNFRNFIQPPRSEARYPVSQSNEGGTGAPKIDFTPNFSGFHTPEGPATSSHHKPDTLPPVESFKKFPTARLPTPASQQDPNKNRTSVNPPKYFSPPVTSPKPQSSSVDGRYPEHFRGEAQKRVIDDPVRSHPSPAKIPKIDPWKLAFDQQIEQRLNSARISHQNSQQNGMDTSKPSPVPTQYPSTYQRHSGNYRGANMYPQPPVQSSVTPYNPSYIQQPQCQPATPQTPQEKLQHRENVGHSPDPEQIIKQISKGVMPDHKLLQDKNVLSILRSSLEEKEAKLMQLREVAKRKEKYKELVTDVTKKPFQQYGEQVKGQLQGKQSLPPFGALTLERMCAPPSFPGHRLNLPRPVDAVKIDIEPTQKYFSPAVKNEAEKSGIPSADLSPQDDVPGPPTDLDGLAAFLAARIRTKGELKQVGPAMEPGRPGLPQHFKTHSTHNAFPSEPLDRAAAPTHSSPATFHTNGSPPKLVRESRLLPPLRRRYFSHTEEDAPTTSGAQTEDHQPMPPRDPNGIRSSSETSVFDFRESDSEGEMPVLERQTLEGMRRDRKTFGSKQNVSTTTPDDVIEAEKPEVIAELDKSHPDPFWDTAFDMFVEQLEKRPPKRSFRKKKPGNQIPGESEKTAEDQDKTLETIEVVEEEEEEEAEAEEEKKDEVCLISVKKEPEERDKLEPVPDGHVKLSSTRLKVYRDEMRLKEEKIDEEKAKPNKPEEKEPEKEEKDKPKGSPTKKKDEIGVKTRGRTKVEEESMDFDSDSDERDIRSESESTAEDDDDSLSLSGLESESTDSDSSEDSSNSNFTTSDDSENETVARKKQRIQTRLQTRSSRQRQVKGTGMKLRSKAMPTPKATAKTTKKKKKRKEDYYTSGKKRKPVFGDGSDFRPGWEEECYKFKQQLRMPEKLINISRPSKRSTVSLPDLDPYRNSPSLDSSDVSMTKKSETGKPGQETDDSDVETRKKTRTQDGSPLGSDNNVGTLLKSRNGKKSQSSSIVNMLVDKYGKGNLKKQKELKAMNERKSPRILPKATNKPELLPTPGLGIGKENVLKDKKRCKDTGKKKLEENEGMYLGYFRRKTVNNFKEAFKQKVGLLPQEFSPVVLKSRTRTQTRDLKKRATLMEVFGDERPASAPPLSREEDTSTDQEKVEKGPEKKKPKVVKKVCGGMVTRGRGKLTRSGRPGLRSTAVLRSNKAVQNSKRHLNAGRKRNIELLRIRAMASKKFSYLVGSSETGNQLPITKKRLKLKSVRRKFRSGFDYIRKKKKLKKDGDSADGSVKEKKLTVRPTSESVEDIQNEIKNWVINKGLGETILHRAARLGYTDVAAYCLEKMECSPSPRDNAGYTPLHEACSRGHLEIAKLLLMYGASVSESAKGGIRPLHEAAENGFTELIRLLLSYGADPLLETYTGHTALSLVSDEEARRLIQHHLADVQGNVAPVWTFQGPATLFDLPESGYDPLSDPPSPSSAHSDFELETSESVLPTLYRLAGDRDTDRRWVLLRDVLLYTKAKSKEAVLKQLGSSTVREMKLTEFHEQSKSCSLFGLGDKIPTKASKVILLPYDDKLRQLLGVEKVLV